LKKQVFINLSKIVGLYNDIVWHATTELEKHDIEKIFGENTNIIVANNLTANYNDLEYDKKISKKEG